MNENPYTEAPEVTADLRRMKDEAFAKPMPNLFTLYGLALIVDGNDHA